MSLKRKTMHVNTAASRLGENIAAWRRLQGIGSEELAERAGISRSTLSRLENGRGDVSLSAVLSCLRVLGVLEQIIAAADPAGSDYGRALLRRSLSERVRG